MSTNQYKILATLFGMLFAFSAFAQQPQDNSPYSRYGIGNLLPQTFSGQAGMGGVSATYYSLYNQNPANPASYGRLNYTSFETGVFHKFSSLSIGSNQVKTNTGNLTHLALGVPIFNPLNRITLQKDKPYDWGMSLGLIPFSSIGYDIEVIDSIANIGQVNYQYRGSGQLYNLYYGNGFHYRGLALGFNVGYLFGQTEQFRLVDFPDVTNPLLTDLEGNTSHAGFTYKFGAQYEYRLKGEGDDDPEKEVKAYQRKGTRLMIGITGNGGYKVRTNSERNYQRGAIGYGLDTIFYSESTIGSAKLPAEVTIGIGLKQHLKWQFNTDVTLKNWSSYTHPDLVEPLANTIRFAVGGEYIPSNRSYNKYAKRIRYRAGMFYGQDPRVIGGEQLNTFGGSLGFGFPIRLARAGISFVHLNLEAGKINNASLLSDTYFKTTIAFTLNDNSWFYKRKYK